MTRSPAGSNLLAEMAMSSLRKVADEAEARACLSALARSGRPLREWARSQQLDGRSLRGWQINLSRRAPIGATAKRERARLVELVPPWTPSLARSYVIRVGDGSIEVCDDFDAK